MKDMIIFILSIAGASFMGWILVTRLEIPGHVVVMMAVIAIGVCVLLLTPKKPGKPPKVPRK